MILFTIIMIFSIVGTLAVFLLFRNNWVSSQRINLILSKTKPPFSLDDEYISYEKMLYKYWWIWDIEKMRL